MLINTRRAYDKFQKAWAAMNRDHRLASDSLRELSETMRPKADFAVLGECVENVAHVSEQLQQVSDTLHADMGTQFLTPLDGVLEGDMAEAEFSKKRFNKVLSDFDAVTKRIQQMQGKGQANPQRMQEALKEQEQLRQKLDSVGQQTMQTLTDVNNRVEFALFQMLIQYVETYNHFFSRGSALVDEASANLAKYRLFSEKKREVIEAGGSGDQVRLEDISAQNETGQARDALERSVMEIVEKERSYVRKLDIISKSYIQNIRVDDVLASKFSDEDHRTIFCNIEDLLMLHKSLVTDLENDLGRHPSYNTASIIGSYIPRMRGYVTYVRNYSQSLNALDQLELRSQSVRKFLRTMDRKNGLRGLLCEPTGRIPSYIIGLKQIAQHTQAGSEEHGRLAAVIAELSSLIEELQEAQTVSNNIGTMLGVYNELSGFPGTLLEQSRVLRAEKMIEHQFTTPDGKGRTELNKFYICSDVLIQAKKRSVLASAKASVQHTGDETGRDKKEKKPMVYVNHFVLEGASLDQLPDNEEMGIVNAVELRVPGQATNGLVLCSSSLQERLELVSLIEGSIAGSVTHPVFQVPLETCMENQRDRSINVPEVLALTCDYLMQHGLGVEGIFRLSGAKREITSIVSKFNRKEKVVLENETADEHTVAGVLKQWVRNLPEPLLTFHLTDGFLRSECNPTVLQELISSLPPLNKEVVTMLFKLLHQVSLQVEVNKMDSKNLAIVFGPGLLRREGASDFDTSHYEAAYAVVGYMIDNFESLFQDGDYAPAAPDTLAPLNPLRASRSAGRSASVSAPSTTAPRKPTGPRPVAAPGAPPSFASELNAQMAARATGGVSAAPSSPPSSPPPSTPVPVSPPVTPPPPAGKVMKKGKSANKMAISPNNSVAKAPDFQAPVKLPPPGRRGSIPAVVAQDFRTRADSLDSSGGRASPIPRADSPASPTSPSSSADDLASSADRPPCARCNQRIRGAGLKALGVAWHKDCFVCTHCSQPFSGKILQKDGKPYCEADYRSLFGGSAPKVCRACEEKISGPFMKALGGYWHANHFLCKACGGSVSDGYYEKDSFPYCANCFDE